MMFLADAAFALTLIALGIGFWVLLKTKNSEANNLKGFGTFLGYFIIVFAFIILLCAGYYTVRYWEDGHFSKPHTGQMMMQRMHGMSGCSSDMMMGSMHGEKCKKMKGGMGDMDKCEMMKGDMKGMMKGDMGDMKGMMKGGMQGMSGDEKGEHHPDKDKK
jgi:hypothetical protein